MAYLETLTSHNEQLQELIDKANALPDAGGGGGGSGGSCEIEINRDTLVAGGVVWVITYTSADDMPHQLTVERDWSIYLGGVRQNSIITITRKGTRTGYEDLTGLHLDYSLYSEDMETGEIFFDDESGLELVGEVSETPDSRPHSMSFWVNSDAVGKFIYLDFS